MSTGAITSEFVDRAADPAPMSEEEAVAAILQGARSGGFTLPPAVRKSAEGAAAVAARATAVHLELNAAAAAVDAGPALLVAEIVRASATTGALSKIDAGAEMVRLEAAVVRLRREEAVYAVAADKIASYPVTILRANAGAVAEAEPTSPRGHRATCRTRGRRPVDPDRFATEPGGRLRFEDSLERSRPRS